MPRYREKENDMTAKPIRFEWLVDWTPGLFLWVAEKIWMWLQARRAAEMTPIAEYNACVTAQATVVVNRSETA